VLTEGDYRK